MQHATSVQLVPSTAIALAQQDYILADIPIIKRLWLYDLPACVFISSCKDLLEERVEWITVFKLALLFQLLNFGCWQQQQQQQEQGQR